MNIISLLQNNYLVLALAVIVSLAIALSAFYIIFERLKKIKAGRFYTSFNQRCRQSSKWVLILLAFRVVVTFLELPDYWARPVNYLLGILLIISISWLLIKITFVLEDMVLFRFSVTEKDNLRARKAQTQIRVLKRIAIVVILIIAIGSALMTLPHVQQIGQTILASAGIIGIVVGFAAQKTLATFVAGLQIAFTQPIRLDDVVIVEGEWGRIEEITLTYVIVAIWDLRRLVVPITYFIETPFQNWTRTTADLLGTVFLYVDYTVPVDRVREELTGILEKTDMWDQKVNIVQITNTTERTVELRALVSAGDAGTLWNLRCHVREKLVDFLQKNYPESLPQARVELRDLSEEPAEKP